MPMPDHFYHTSNFYLAAFLYAKGVELADIERTENRKRAVFVFVESPDRERFVHHFNFAPDSGGEAAIDARKFVYAIKTLKEKLYQD